MTIKIKSLTKKYKDFVAVNNVSFDIKTNETFSLLGINGAGKTTLIKMLTGLTKKTNGEVFYDEYNIDKNLNEIKQIINISPQENAVAENLTVKENIMFIAEIYGFSKEKIIKNTQNIINLLNLQEFENKKAKNLSGGTQRRLSLAMSLVTEPKILFLDEPTLGLDVLAREQLWDLIEKLKSKMTIILTTHYMEEAEKLSDRIGIIHNGEIIKIDTPSSLMKSTKTKSLEQAFVKIVKGEKTWNILLFQNEI